MSKNKDYRFFTVHKLNNKDIEFGRVKISRESGKPLDAAKKLLRSICEYEGLTKMNKLKCKVNFYIRETTRDSKKRIYGPYKGSFKKYDKPVIIKLDNGLEIKHKMYAKVIKGEKMIIQKGGFEILKTIQNDSSIYCVIQLSDNKIIYGCADGSLNILNLSKNNGTNIPLRICNSGVPENNRQYGVKKCNAHKMAVSSIIQLINGSVVSCSWDGTLKIWDITTNESKSKCVMTLKGNNEYVTCVIQLDDNIILSGSSDNTLKIWDLRKELNKQCVLTLHGHTLPVTCAIKLNDGRIVSGSNDNTLKIWDIIPNTSVGEITGNCVSTLMGHTNFITSVIQLEDNIIISGSADKTLKIWDVSPSRNISEKYTFNIELRSYATCLFKLYNGNVIYGCIDCTLKILDFANLPIDNTILTDHGFNKFTGHEKQVNCLIQRTNGDIVSGSDDNTLKFWKL